MKKTILSSSRGIIGRPFAMPVLLFAWTAVMSAQGVITSGSIVAVGGDQPPTDISLQGSNFSIGGDILGGGLDIFTGHGTATTVTYNPNVSTSIYGATIGFTYNGTNYSNFQFAFTISAPMISLPNTIPPAIAQYGNYQASFANIPFTMSGLVTVYSGQSQGTVLFTLPLSGSGVLGGTVQPELCAWAGAGLKAEA